MQIKHTFLLLAVLGFVWTGYLFAIATGPDPGVNGIAGPAIANTCAMSGCHTGNNLNAAGGSLSISGLPAAWTPGQTYALTITIARTGARLFGFQLSAVSDATNQQAGTLAPGHARVKIVCGPPSPSIVLLPCTAPGAVQYAEHSNAAIVTSTYLVNWTAPASASAGTVRFNLAGNAANGDASSSGDFIYTRVDRVDPENGPPPPPPPPPPDLTTRAFTFVDRGGISVITDGGGDLSVGYSRIQPDAGQTAPAGVAIFGLQQNGVVVTEAGVPASLRLTSARIYAEVTTAVNTGVAIANPNDQPANVSFHFTDAAGVDFGAGVLTLVPISKRPNF